MSKTKNRVIITPARTSNPIANARTMVIENIEEMKYGSNGDILLYNDGRLKASVAADAYWSVCFEDYNIKPLEYPKDGE